MVTCQMHNTLFFLFWYVLSILVIAYKNNIYKIFKFMLLEEHFDTVLRILIVTWKPVQERMCHKEVY